MARFTARCALSAGLGLLAGAGLAVGAQQAEVDLASDTAWTLRADDGPARPIKVTAGGWNSDRQQPQIPAAAVQDHVTYERQINIPDAARNQTVKVLFGGCNYGAEVWLDDRQVAEHVAPMTPFEADLTGVAVPGRTHRLRVKAYTRMHYGAPPNIPVGFDFNQDIPGVKRPYNGCTKFPYGLTGYVRLVVWPAVYVAEVFVKPSVTRRTLSCAVWLANSSATARQVQLSAALAAWNRKDWNYPAIPAQSVAVPAGQTVPVTWADLPWTLGPASYWWPNIPYRADYAATLHWLQLTLAEQGRTVGERRQRFGFVEHAEGPFYYTVNGVRYTGFGDCLSYGQVGEYDCWTETPCFQPPHGRVQGCPETWRRYQRIGFNTLRLSTSVPTETMLATADEAGFLLIPEGGSWGNHTARFDRANFARQLQALIRVARNHPSVARYSLCNEPREPRDANWCWRGIMDDARAADDTRPLVMEVHNTGGGRVDSLTGAAHAWGMEHYANPDRPADARSGIRGMGEYAWGTDDMVKQARQGLRMRLNDWAYFAPWSWANFWPNFLEGMNHDRHPWKYNDHADRTDGVDGWGSPIVKLVQRSLHPYLVYDRGTDKTDWPYQPPVVPAGQAVERRLEVFNGGLAGNRLVVVWRARWDQPDGPLALPGGEWPCTIEPGFHATLPIAFTLPAPGREQRKLYLLLEARKDGRTVFADDGTYLQVVTRLSAPTVKAPGAAGGRPGQ